MQKVSKVLLTIFGIGALLTLFAGGLALIGFIVALCIGGETATEMCVFIHKTYFPYVIQACSVSVAIGIAGMYCGKLKALSMKEDKKEE